MRSDDCQCRRYEIQVRIPAKHSISHQEYWESVQDARMFTLRYPSLDDKKFRSDLRTARKAHGAENISVLCITETRIYIPKAGL